MLTGLRRKLAIIIPVIAVSTFAFVAMYANQIVEMAYAGGAHN